MEDLLVRYVTEIERELEKRGRSRWWGPVTSFSENVRRALLTVKRHCLLDGLYKWEEGVPVWVPLAPECPSEEVLKEYVYANTPVVTKVSPQGEPLSSSSEPVLVASMLELLELKPGMKVLEIGTGTGYNAALLAEIVGDQSLVTTLEIQSDVAERANRLLRAAGYGGVQVRCADGFYGWPEEAPYDRIVATTCCADISPHWLQQVAPQGWMLVPLCHGGKGWAPLTQVSPDGRGRVLALAGFGPATGMLADPGPWYQAPVPTSWPSGEGLTGRKMAWSSEDVWDFVLSLSHFHYFLALNDPGACLYWRSGVYQVLWDAKLTAGAFLSRDNNEWVRVTGSQELGERLERNYREYKELGEPRVEDYRMEFLLRPAPREASRAVPGVRRVGPREWVIERRFTIQRVWLPA
jgi:protein-L-isoaspartate(D-aspartate) O-methyltransferase